MPSMLRCRMFRSTNGVCHRIQYAGQQPKSTRIASDKYATAVVLWRRADFDADCRPRALVQNGVQIGHDRHLSVAPSGLCVCFLLLTPASRPGLLPFAPPGLRTWQFDSEIAFLLLLLHRPRLIMIN